MTDIALRILLQAQNQMSNVIGGAVKDLMAINPVLGGIVGVGLAVGAAVVGIGVKSTQMAADFQQAMLQNVAHAGLAADQVNNVTSALMQMGPAVGQGPTALANAMYPVLSGLSSMTDQAAKSKVALVELNNAAKSVAGTTTDVGAVTFAQISTYNAYGLATNNVALATSRLNMISDVMNQTVSEGNMKWDTYSRMVGNFMAKAGQAHVGITEANAALAVFTNSGESAQLAGTHLGALFLYLGTQSAKMADNARKLHLTFDAQKFATMDLAQKMEYLQHVTGGNFAEVQKLMGGNKTLASTFQKLHDHARDYQTALTDINNASKGKGATQTAFDIAKTGANFQGQQMGASLQALGITIGSKLLPYVSALMSKITPLIASFTQWVEKSGIVQKIITVVGFVLGVLAADFQIIWPYIQRAIAAVVQFGQALMTRLQPIIAHISQFIRANWQNIVGFLKGIFEVIQGIIQIAWNVISGIIKIAMDILGGNWKQAWTDMQTMLSGVWDGIKKVLQGAWDFISNAFKTWIGGIGTLAKGIFTGVIDAIKGGINFVIGLIDTVIGKINGIHVNTPFGSIGFNIPLIPKLAQGGQTTSGGLFTVGEEGSENVWLPGGATVFPHNAFSGGGGGAGGGTIINVAVYAGLMTDRRQAQQLATIVGRELATKWRSQANIQQATSGSVRS